jgi:RHS repeat-associated protein
MQTAGSWTRENTTGNNFLYNSGSELNNVSNIYETFFRGYDPVLGRMTAVDPAASQYASLTPYNYSFNDPVYWNDPTGADPMQHIYDMWKLIDGINTAEEGGGGSNRYIPTYGVPAHTPSIVEMARDAREMDEADYLMKYGTTYHVKIIDYFTNGIIDADHYIDTEYKWDESRQGFNLMSGVITVNGVPMVGLSYNSQKSSGTLVETLSNTSGTVWDIKDNSLSNPRAIKDPGAVLKTPSGPNGIRVPLALAKAAKEKEFRDALGPYTDEFWFRFQQGHGAIYYQSTNKGVYENSGLYSVSEFRFTASYSIFVGKDQPPIQIGFTFDVSVYEPIVINRPDFTNVYIKSLGQH